MSRDRLIQFVEDVKSRVSLVDLVRSDGCVLRGNRVYLSGLSPLRKEKTPSFSVYVATNSWCDRGTGDGGDVIRYVEKRDRCSFMEALSTLGRLAGLDLFWEHPSYEDKDKLKHEIEATIERQGVYQRLTEATEYYHHEGNLPECILKVLHENYGITDETIQKFKIGYGWPDLWGYFRQDLGYAEEACLKTGLFAFNPKTKSYDGILDGRIVFPYEIEGLTRYFIGRRNELTTSDDEWNKSKYKKLQIFDRNKKVSEYVSNDWLFNEDALRKSSSYIVLTEGVTDCIAFDQHEITSASPVTVTFNEASIPRILKLLERCNKNRERHIIICNDADEHEDGTKPGERGALKMCAVLTAHGYDVRIATLPKPPGAGKVDSCEFLRDHGKEAMVKVLDAAKRYVDYLMERVPLDLEPAELERQLNPVLEAIASCPSSIQRDAYQSKLRKRFDLAKGTVSKGVTSAKKQVREAPAPATEPGREDEEQVASVHASKPKSKPHTNGIKVRGNVYKDDDIGSASNRYLTDTTNGAEQISSFCLVPTQKIVEDGKELVQCDIHMTSGRVVKNFVFPHGAWNSRPSFVECFNSMDMSFTGNNEHVHGIRQLIGEQEVPYKEATKNVGYFESSLGRRWAWPGGCIDQNGLQESPDVICKPRSTRLSDLLRYEFVDNWEDVAKTAYPLLTRVNRPEVVLPLIAWFHATMFKPRLMPITRGFPVLMVYGTAGSGKTSLLKDVFWQLMGVANNATVYSCTETPYAMMENLSRTNSVPTVFDEFKPGEMKANNIKQIQALVRYVYGEQIEERGRPDLSVTQIRITTPMVIAGESMLDGDTSILERTIYVNPRKDTLVDSDNRSYTHAFHKLRREKLWQLAAPYIQWSLSKEVTVELLAQLRERAVSICKRVSTRDLAPRIQENVTVFLFGIEMFNAWCEHLGIDPYIGLQPMMDMIEITVQNMVDELGGGSFIEIDEQGNFTKVIPDSPKDVFDHFLEALSTYGHTGLLEEGINYAQIDGKLCLHLPSCYNIYIVERARSRQEDATGGLTALRRAIDEKVRRGDTYITAANRRMRLTGLPGTESRHPYVRCIEIDPKKIPRFLQYDPLKVSDSRSHGGYRNSNNTN